MKVDYDLVYNVYLGIRSNIRNKKSIFYFELLLDSNINYIVNKINNNDYKLGKYNIFYIKEKKYRLILSNNIYDKIYNHLVSDLILSKLDKYLIDSNVASRKNKGTRYGRCLLHRYIYELKRNNKVFYILKFDIKKYFFNIDHDILINKLSKYLNNNKYKLNLPIYKKNKGISIGSVSSQMLAVFYLNDLDHFIKEELGVKYYIRYMDDGIILMDSFDALKRVYDSLKEIIKKYKLEFNSKTKIYRSSEGFSFLGINYYVRNNKLIKRISKRNKKKILYKINNINYKFYKNYIKYIK